MRHPILRWIALSGGAFAVASAAGLVFFAANVEVEKPLHAGVLREMPERRPAGPSLGKPRFEVPIERLSRIHIAIEALAHAESTSAPGERRAKVRVALDTGASTAFATAHGAERFPLRTAPRSLRARSFHGGSSAFYPYESGEELTLSLGAEAAPGYVATAVRYVAPATLYGADVIAPPQEFAPKGGAVAIDLRRNIFSVCESVNDCRGDTPLSELELERCDEVPELIGLVADVSGERATLLFDTGAATLLFAPFYGSSGLSRGEHAREVGQLTGMAEQGANATLATGAWSFVLAGTRPLARSADRLWVVNPSREGVAHCFKDGSIGVDLLNDCRIVLAAGDEQRALVSCAK